MDNLEQPVELICISLGCERKPGGNPPPRNARSATRCPGNPLGALRLTSEYRYGDLEHLADTDSIIGIGLHT